MSFGKHLPKVYVVLPFLLVAMLYGRMVWAQDLDEDVTLTAEAWSAPDWAELLDPAEAVRSLGCKKANSSQLAVVNSGNQKLPEFLRQCALATSNSPWCTQLTRPNPDSVSIFQCTYGAKQQHNLIHPDERTWKNAFQAVQLVQNLEANGIRPCLIYNWWRPEPYNRNVGGAAGRHPFATSVDVRFCNLADMEKAFLQLCKWRAQGKLRAVGYYGTTGLHFGVGDQVGNTWGKACPSSLTVEEMAVN